jgi:hypothetical protein
MSFGQTGGTIIEETNSYAREQAPTVPLGPSADERKRHLVSQMWGVDEEAMQRQVGEERTALADAPPFTMDDQILSEIQDRTSWLENMHDLGIHAHDGETLRQIDQLIELKKRIKQKGEAPPSDDSD